MQDAGVDIGIDPVSNSPFVVMAFGCVCDLDDAVSRDVLGGGLL